MVEISDRDLVRFVFGRVDPQVAARIEQRRRADSAFDERIRLREMIATNLSSHDEAPSSSPVPPKQIWHSRAVLKHPIILATVLLVAFGGSAIAGWWYLIDRPLLADEFAMGWFDSSKWMPPPAFIKAGGIRADKGAVRLVNRGYLVPRAEFDGPIDLRFEWKWSLLGLNPSYSETLTVGVRTSGEASLSNYNELKDGMGVNFNAWGGFVEFSDKDESHPSLLSTQHLQPRIAYPMPAEQWHKIRVTDDGTTINVYIAGPEIPKFAWENPVLSYVPKVKLTGKRFAIYNRELVAFPHESQIRNLEVRRLR